MPGGEPVRELGPGADTEFRVSAREVHLDRVHRDEQRRSDLLVGPPLSRELDHAPFARRQLALRRASTPANAIEL